MRIGVGVAALVLTLCLSAAAHDVLHPVVFLSREVRPYLLAVEALERELGRPVLRLYTEDGLSALEAALERLPERGRVVAAVGPEAVESVSRLHPVPPTVALMVVDPPPWPGDAPPLAAVVLRLPLEDQIQRLHAAFPSLGPVAVPVGPPAMSEAVVQAFSSLRRPFPFRVWTFPLSEPPAWGQFLDQAAAAGARVVVFPPHPDLAATAVLRHVTAQTVLRRMMAVGYNRLFLEAGAGAAFLADAAGVGRVGAALLRDGRFGVESLVRIAPYGLVIKAAVVHYLGVAPADPLPEGVSVE